MEKTNLIFPQSTKEELAAVWRERAASYEALVRFYREEGDTKHAEEFEAIANDYRIDADRIEEEA